MSIENLSTRTTEIDGVAWECNPFSATNGIRLLKRLIKVVGPTLAALFEKPYEILLDHEGQPILDENGEPLLTEKPLNGEMASTRAAKLLIQNIDNEDIIDIIKIMVSTTRKDGKAVNFDQEFATRYDVLFEVVTWVFRENFAKTFRLVGM